MNEVGVVGPPRVRVVREPEGLLVQRLVTLTDFLGNVLLKDTNDTIAVFNVATGVRFTKRASSVSVDDLLLATDKDKLLAALERLLIQSTKAAVVIEYAEAIAPAGDPSFPGGRRPRRDVTLHRWSFLPEIEQERQRRHPHRREPDRSRAEAGVESEGRGRRRPDAGSRDAQGRRARSRTRGSRSKDTDATPRSPPV